jgi:endonuclease G, mitochondrial
VKDVGRCGRGRPAHRCCHRVRAGKGPVPRATLYFLLRYPGLVDPDELPAGWLEVLLNWYEQFPVGDYERHRNATTNGTTTPPSSPQANRNPLVDHPE